MICPYCDNQVLLIKSLNEGAFFSCLFKCTEWITDIDDNIFHYKIAWRDKDKDKSYIAYADSTFEWTRIFLSNYSEDKIVELSYFVPIKDQWDLDGIIPRLLRLKVFS